MLWIHAFVLWLENEPVRHQESNEEIRAAQTITPKGGG